MGDYEKVDVKEQERILARADDYEKLSGKELVASARKLVEAPPKPELVIHVSVAESAVPRDAKTFDSGLVLGRAYAFDPTTKSIACVGDVAATSSDTVRVWRTKNQRDYEKVDVNLDLYLNLVRTAITSLHA